ncbi:MAG: hypothetical protein VKJ87_05950 [Synechococcus sp.]|nr:hypothetical protein [Synechococcus sp.]
MTHEEVATLVDLCFAAAASDMIPRRRDSQLRVNRFLIDVQSTLFDGAQQFWQTRRQQSAAA